MEKSISALLILFSLFAFSQESIVPAGVYTAVSSNSQGIKLTVSEDNTFQLTIFKGTFEKENDTIYFHSENENKPNFEVEYVYAKSDKIKVSFDKMIANDYYTTYFGTQKINDTEPKYEKLKQLLNIKNTSSFKSKREDFSFEIDKSAFVYLAENSMIGSTLIEKYEIPNGVSEIKIKKVSSVFKGVKLKGFYNAEKLEFIISEGKSPITFVKEESSKENKNLVQPIEKLEKPGWSLQNDLSDSYDDFDVEMDSTYVVEDYEDSPSYKPPYSFKHTVVKNYADALKSIDKSAKFLVVSFDNQKDAEKSFDDFIKKSEFEMSNFMYDGYNPKVDYFQYYLATEKDTKLLSKNKINKNPVLLFFNPKGELIYHTEGTLKQNKRIFNVYNSIYGHLELTNQKLQLDQLFSNKKATLSEFKSCLSRITNLSGFSLNDYDSEEEYDEEEVVVEVQEDYSGNGIGQPIEDAENLYTVTTSKEKIQVKWNEIIDFYTKTKLYDAEFVAIAKAEISKNGFTKQLFNEKTRLFTNSDFLLLDYIFLHYNTIVKEESENENSINSSGIASVLEKAFTKNLQVYSNPERIGIDKVMNYFNQFNKISNYKLKNIEVYISTLKESNEGSTDYLIEYGKYFDSQFGSSSSVIESLDALYSSQNEYNWRSFKDSFTRFANTMAWDVVEANITDKKMIQSAIKWSEASLKVKPNDGYYLDTLGQLYYRNGEKEKGIASEQKAVEAIKNIDESEYKKYVEVLEKMKNGTY